MRSSFTCTIALCVVLRASGAVTTLGVWPSSVPVGSNALLLLSELGSVTTYFNVSLLSRLDGGTVGAPVTLTAVRVSSSAAQVLIPAALLSGPGLLLVAPANAGSPTVPVVVFKPTVWLSPSPARWNNFGLVHATLDAAASTPLWLQDGVNARVLVACNCTVAAQGVTLMSGEPGVLPKGLSFAYTAEGIGSLIPGGGSRLAFRTKSLPPSGCASVLLFVSTNGGGSWVPVGGSIAVDFSPPLVAVSLYTYNINSSPWSYANFLARSHMSSDPALSSTVDASLYTEEAWRRPAVLTGVDVQAQFFAAATAANASVIYCAGTQFSDSAKAYGLAHPDVRVLLLSSQLTPLVNATPNVAFATARMYDAQFFLGFIAAASSPSGKLCFMASLVQATSFAFLNAFALGAAAAFTRGFAPASAQAPTVTAYALGSFANEWAEANAGREFVDTFHCDVLNSLTDSSSPEKYMISHSGAVFGWSVDERLVLGDAVLASAIFTLEPIYAAYLERAVNAVDPWQAPSLMMGGIGSSVQVVDVSPRVPLTAQVEVGRLLADAATWGDMEGVFCGEITNSDGGVILNASGWVNATLGFSPAVRGVKGAWCLSPVDVNAQCVGPSCATTAPLFWTVSGVAYRGLYMPPAQPLPPVSQPWALQENSPALFRAFMAAPATLWALGILCALGVAATYETPTMVSSDRSVLPLLSIGAALAGVAFWLLFFPPSTALCTGAVYAEGLSFALSYTVLVAKALRVHKIINNTKLRLVRVGSGFLWAVIAAAVAAEVAACAGITALFPPGAVLRNYVASGGGGYYWSECGNTSQGGGVDALFVVCGLHLIVLLYGAWLSYRTRKSPEGFNETAHASAAFNVEFLGIVIAFILGSLPDNSGLQLGVPFYSARVPLVLAPCFMLVVIFAPKFVAIAQEPGGRTVSRRGSSVTVDRRSSALALAPLSASPRVLPAPGLGSAPLHNPSPDRPPSVWARVFLVFRPQRAGKVPGGVFASSPPATSGDSPSAVLVGSPREGGFRSSLKSSPRSSVSGGLSALPLAAGSNGGSDSSGGGFEHETPLSQLISEEELNAIASGGSAPRGESGRISRALRNPREGGGAVRVHSGRVSTLHAIDELAGEGSGEDEEAVGGQ